MENTARQLQAQLQAKVVGHIDLPQANLSRQNSPASTSVAPDTRDSFLTGQADRGWQADHLKREAGRALAEIGELQAANRWQDIIALFHPLEKKLPELVDAGMDAELRLRLSFALCQGKRHEDAIGCLQPVVAKDESNRLAHYNIGYCVLDYFFEARTKRLLIPAKRKAELLKLAHLHFEAARRLSPESVSFFYREAILYKEIEDKPKLAAPLFQQAIVNWRRLSTEEQTKYHQQRPKYSKSLYHLASCRLTLGQPKNGLTLLEELLAEDQSRDYVHPLFKHFAMGKVLHALGRYGDSLQHLETACHVAENGQPTDFVHELAARSALCLQQPQRAMECINRIPRKQRRPYVLWTEAAVLTALGRRQEAISLLRHCADSDRRARHVALIQLGRLALQDNEVQQALESLQKAVRFCVDTYGNASKEARFWEAVCLYRLNRMDEARLVVEELENQRYQYPNFNRLRELVRQRGDAAPTPDAGRPAGREVGLTVVGPRKQVQ